MDIVLDENCLDILSSQLRLSVPCDVIIYMAQSNLGAPCLCRLCDFCKEERWTFTIPEPFLFRMAWKRPGETFSLEQLVTADMRQRAPYFYEKSKLLGLDNVLGTAFPVHTEVEGRACLVLGRKAGGVGFNAEDVLSKKRALKWLLPFFQCGILDK